MIGKLMIGELKCWLHIFSPVHESPDRWRLMCALASGTIPCVTCSLARQWVSRGKEVPNVQPMPLTQVKRDLTRYIYPSFLGINPTRLTVVHPESNGTHICHSVVYVSQLLPVEKEYISSENTALQIII